MTELPLYRGHGAPNRPPAGAHLGLWHSRFFRYEEGWTLDDPDTKNHWLRDLAQATCSDTELPEATALRLLRLGRSLGAESRELQASWHFASGLGLPHPLENGFAWHPTLGVPYLTGTAVKGILRGWLEEWSGETAELCQERRRRWLGEPEQPGKPDRAGDLIFFDALPITAPSLVVDVMTPHMGKWYERGDQIEEIDSADSAELLPGDFHSPNPVKFLVAKQPSFLVQIAARTETARAEVPAAFAEMRQALDLLGAGAKTAAGYGQLIPGDKRILSRLERQLDTQERHAGYAALDPFDRSLAKLAEKAIRRKKPDYELIVEGLYKNTWQGDELLRAARKAKELMLAQDHWRPRLLGKARNDKPHMRTLKIIRLLGEKP